MGRVFHCVCERPVFFRNSQCLHCGHALGYLPEAAALLPLEPDAEVAADGAPALWRIVGEASDGLRYQRCANLDSPAGCNWLLRPEDAGNNGLCRCCRLNRMVPDLGVPAYADLWRRVELAKRRLVSSLITLGLPVASRLTEDMQRGMAFDLLVGALAPAPVMTGHQNGIITLNVDEADDAVREAVRSAMQEPYRTVLGHLRHESGHYYWSRLLDGGPWLEPFRALFGDERQDYGSLLANYHANGPQPNWALNFVSAYASAHPWEDWAETWAHYLHMLDALDTALSTGVDITRVERQLQDPFDQNALCQVMLPTLESMPQPEVAADAPPTLATSEQHFLAFVNAWVALTGMVNELSRSMGQHDFYPFVMSVPVVAKLHFIHRFVTYCRESAGVAPAAPGTLSVAGEEDPGAAMLQPVAEGAPAM